MRPGSRAAPLPIKPRLAAHLHGRASVERLPVQELGPEVGGARRLLLAARADHRGLRARDADVGGGPLLGLGRRGGRRRGGWGRARRRRRGAGGRGGARPSAGGWGGTARDAGEHRHSTGAAPAPVHRARWSAGACCAVAAGPGRARCWRRADSAPAVPRRLRQAGVPAPARTWALPLPRALLRADPLQPAVCSVVRTWRVGAPRGAGVRRSLVNSAARRARWLPPTGASQPPLIALTHATRTLLTNRASTSACRARILPQCRSRSQPKPPVVATAPAGSSVGVLCVSPSRAVVVVVASPELPRNLSVKITPRSPRQPRCPGIWRLPLAASLVPLVAHRRTAVAPP